jgi:hypothetical protein
MSPRFRDAVSFYRALSLRVKTYKGAVLCAEPHGEVHLFQENTSMCWRAMSHTQAATPISFCWPECIRCRAFVRLAGAQKKRSGHNGRSNSLLWRALTCDPFIAAQA